MENKINITLVEQGIAVQGESVNLNGEKYNFGFLVSFDEEDHNWNDARKFCEECGGSLPSVEQLRVLAEHRKQINKQLEEAGHKLILGWYWSDKEDWDSSDLAWYVGMGHGNWYNDSKYNSYHVRAVSDFHVE